MEAIQAQEQLHCSIGEKRECKEKALGIVEFFTGDHLFVLVVYGIARVKIIEMTEKGSRFIPTSNLLYQSVDYNPLDNFFRETYNNTTFANHVSTF